VYWAAVGYIYSPVKILIMAWKKSKTVKNETKYFLKMISPFDVDFCIDFVMMRLIFTMMLRIDLNCFSCEFCMYFMH
jgi:hypothetical protein